MYCKRERASTIGLARSTELEARTKTNVRERKRTNPKGFHLQSYYISGLVCGPWFGDLKHGRYEESEGTDLAKLAYRIRESQTTHHLASSNPRVCNDTMLVEQSEHTLLFEICAYYTNSTVPSEIGSVKIYSIHKTMIPPPPLA